MGSGNGMNYLFRCACGNQSFMVNLTDEYLVCCDCSFKWKLNPMVATDERVAKCEGYQWRK